MTKLFVGNVKRINREMARENLKWPEEPQEIPRDKWPALRFDHDPDLVPLKVFRSRRFFIQVVLDRGHTRISVNRTQLDENFEYVQGITWDELFEIKNAVGYADKDCIEIYPAKKDLVNVANMRHLFVLDDRHPCNWGTR